MLTLGEILNLIDCSAQGILGTGTFGCRPYIKKTVSIWLTPQGFEYDSAQILDEDYTQLLQQQGNLVVLKGVDTPTDQSSDDTIDESEDGIKQVANEGRYEFLFQFQNGLYFHAALSALDSFRVWDATLVDSQGNILGTRSSAGNLKGFTIGMLQGQRLQFPTSAVGQREGIVMQWLNRSELDRDYVYIQNQQIAPFDPTGLDGINEIILSFGAVPTNLGTTITIDAVRAQDGAVFTGGVDYTDFGMIRDNVQDDPTAGDDAVTPGTYILTTSAHATNEVLEVRLFDQALSLNAIEVGNRVYKSNVTTETVV